MVLQSIKSRLDLETDYTVQSFLSPREAIDQVKENEIDVVVSDYLMPEMDGITFLGKVREIRPEVPRIILTGYADKENAIKAINEVGLFHYIEKPWDNDNLLLVLRNGIEKKQLLRELQKKIQEINIAYGDLQDLQKEILKTFV
jgi:DNA-binding NtrC family response regulator